MTISTTIRKATFTGDGSQTIFPFAFKVFTTADLLAVQAVAATGVETALALTTHYTVALNADQNASPGGNLTMLVAPPTGTSLTLTSAVAPTQGTDLTNQGGFYPAVITNALDKLTVLVQQNVEKLARAFTLPLSDTTSPVLPGVAARADRLLAFDPATGAPGVSTFTQGGLASAVASVNSAAGNAAAAAASATQAATQVTLAAAQVTLAAGQATLATTAKTGAEAARDAALAAARIYATTAAGLAASTDGQYFYVPSTNPDESLILYQRVAGAAVDIKHYSAAFAPVQKTNQAILQVADSDGNVALDINANFAIDSTGGMATPALAFTTKDLNNQFALSDSDGNLVFAITAQGKLVATLDKVPTALKTGGTYDYEVNHLFTYGQSLSVGQATPAISTVQAYDNVMFTRGMRPQYDYPAEAAGVWYAALVPAVEAQSPVEALLAETPSMGAGDMIKQRILTEDGLAYTDINYQMLLSAPGYGATTIGQLSQGTAHYNRLIAQATYGLALATAASKTYAVQAVAWVQGESNYGGTPQATYTAALNTLITNLNTDIKAVTGQTKNIPLISYQISTHKVGGSATPIIALAQLEVAQSNALATISTPMYIMDYQGVDDYHITSVSSRLLGAYMGLAYKRVVIDGLAWKPVMPLSSIKSGAIAVVKFNTPSGRLVFDTSLVALNTNYGFELVDSGGTALTINSVSISGPNSVKIVAAASIPAGAKLRYAWSGLTATGVTGPRGNLRDTQGDSIVFDPNGMNRPMHNWCVIFEISL